MHWDSSIFATVSYSKFYLKSFNCNEKSQQKNLT